MLERGYGDIVNIGSIASHQGFENSTAYCAAKHGVLGFSRALALEVRKRGLRVITVSPGSVNTPLWDPMEWTPDRSKMLHADEVAEAVHAALTVSSTAAIDEADRNAPRKGCCDPRIGHGPWDGGALPTSRLP